MAHTSITVPGRMRRAGSLLERLARPHIPAFHITRYSLHSSHPPQHEHIGDPDEEPQFKFEPVPAGLQELFFDLIFVASVIQLATFVKHETSWTGVYQAFLVFCVLWLTWLHMTFLSNRFQAPLIAKFGEFLYMASTLVLSFESFAGKEHEVGLFHRAFYAAFVCNRVVLAVMYCKVMVDIPSTASTVKVHLWVLSLSIAAGVAGMVLDNETGGLGSAVVILLVEFAMYPLAHTLVDEGTQLRTDVHHFNERIELWTILILGESIISLVVFPAQIESHGVQLYESELAAFAVVYLLLQIQTVTQPTKLEADFDEHALDLSSTHAMMYGLLTVPLTFGLFLFGAGLKLMVNYGLGYPDASKWKQEHAFVLTGGLAAGLIFTVLRQMTHEWGHVVFGRWWGRPLVYAFKLVLSACIAPLALLVHNEAFKDTSGATQYARTGADCPEFMFYLLLFISALLAVEAVCVEDDDDVAEYGVYTREVERAMTVLLASGRDVRRQDVSPRAHWTSAAHRVMGKKTQEAVEWDELTDVAVRFAKTRRMRSRLRGIGDARTLRYTGPIGRQLRAKLRQVLRDEPESDEANAIREFTKIILEAVREDARKGRRSTMIVAPQRDAPAGSSKGAASPRHIGSMMIKEYCLVSTV